MIESASPEPADDTKQAEAAADRLGADSTVDDLLGWARARLRASVDGELDPREATTLVGLALGWTQAQVYARGDQAPSADQRRHLEELVHRRVRGEPYAYLSGHREFYGREFEVDARVLIPRPETEHVIEACLALEPVPRFILDVGTGSGCIALTLGLEIPDARILACDVSLGALAVARRNLARLAREDESLGQRVRLFASDLLAAVEPRGPAVDTLVSNPPYIARGDQLPHTVVDFEPDVALFSGAQGTEVYRGLLESMASRRMPRAVFELGADQASNVIEIARGVGLEVAGTRRDLAGWERVLVVRDPAH